MCDSIRTTKSTVKPFALSDQRELEVIALDGEIRKHVVFFYFWMEQETRGFTEKKQE